MDEGLIGRRCDTFRLVGGGGKGIQNGRIEAEGGSKEISLWADDGRAGCEQVCEMGRR